jgi:hypothetical protein
VRKLRGFRADLRAAGRFTPNILTHQWPRTPRS